MLFHALSFAGSRGSCLNTRPIGTEVSLEETIFEICDYTMLTNISLASFLCDIGKQASDQGLHCLLHVSIYI